MHWAAEIGLLPSLELLLQACGEETERQLAAYRSAGVFMCVCCVLWMCVLKNGSAAAGVW